MQLRNKQIAPLEHTAELWFAGCVKFSAPTRRFFWLAGLSLSVMAARNVNAQTNSVTNGFAMPLDLSHGAALVSVRVNESKLLTFKLDTGFGVTTIHPDLVETLQLKPAGDLTIIGIAGDEKAGWYSGATLDFGGTKYSPRRVAVIPSDAQRRRRSRDGILGAGFFRRFVVEINPAKNTLTLREADNFSYTGKGEIVPLSFRKDTPIVDAAIHFANREPIRARYEIDSGCDGELCLGHDFVKANQLNEATGTGRAGSRRGVGGSVDTHHGVLPQFQLGKQKLDDLPANFFQDGSPVGEGLAGHIGMGTLRKFKVILDYARRRMILEPLK